MKVTTHINKHVQVAEVYPFADSNTHITVCRNKIGDKWEASDISWPSIGAVNVAKAREFANGLNLAHSIANNLNHDVLPQPTEA